MSSDSALSEADLAASEMSSLQDCLEASTSPQVTKKTVVLNPGFQNPEGIIRLQEEISVRLEDYIGTSPPVMQVLLPEDSVPRSNVSRTVEDIDPCAPRETLYESAAELQNWFLNYQSDEDTASEEDLLEYALTISDTAGTSDHLSEDESTNQQDVPVIQDASGTEQQQTEEDPAINEDFS